MFKHIREAWLSTGCYLYGTTEQHDAMLEHICNTTMVVDKDSLSIEIYDFLYM